jgi:hypothetical protein
MRRAGGNPVRVGGTYCRELEPAAGKMPHSGSFHEDTGNCESEHATRGAEFARASFMRIV